MVRPIARLAWIAVILAVVALAHGGKGSRDIASTERSECKSSPASDGQVLVNTDFIAKYGVAKIWIVGKIDQGAACDAIDVMRGLFQDARTILLSLNSPGGNVAAAMQIGEEVRKRGAWTMVDDDSACASACPLILAAGVRRIAAEHRVGIHRPYFEPSMFASLSREAASAKYEARSREVKAYLSRMGMPDELFELMLRQPSDGVLWLDNFQLTRLGLEGNDPAYDEWVSARKHAIPDDVIWPKNPAPSH